MLLIKGMAVSLKKFLEKVSENVGDTWYSPPRREDYPSAA